MAALVQSGANRNDRFHRVIELDEQNFRYDPTFPDVRTKRTNDLVLVEVLLGAGRSVRVRKQILSGIVERLAAQGQVPENVMVRFQDLPWENRPPAGGRMLHG